MKESTSAMKPTLSNKTAPFFEPLFCAGRIAVLIIIILAASAGALAQAPTAKAEPTPQPTPSLEQRFFKNLLKDQYAIWTSPLHLRGRDAAWLAPLGVATGALIATDRHTAGSLNNDRTRLRVSRDISYVGAVYTTGATAAALYLAGRELNNSRLRETGLLGAEALIDGAVVAEVLKAATQRPRPLNDVGRGRFFTGGNSFPSGHAMNAWTLATIIAKEYKDRPLVQITSYGLAAAVGVSRFTVRKHFLSDVLVGSAMGYGIGNFVYHENQKRKAEMEDEKKATTNRASLLPLFIPSYNFRARAYSLSLKWNL